MSLVLSVNGINESTYGIRKLYTWKKSGSQVMSKHALVQ